MKKIPIVTILFWAVFLIGSWLLPGIFKQDGVQLPAAVILSVFLPVSFWQLAKRKKKYPALLFIGILLSNALILLVAVQGNYSAQQALVKELNKGIHPELAAYVETAVSSGKRRSAAQFIYQLHGVALPYKNDADAYTLYSPNEADKEKYRKNFFSANALKLRSRTVFSSLQTAVFLLITHVALFTGLIVFLILYDEREVGVEGGGTGSGKGGQTV